jgi:hypothetical protein
MNLACSGLAPNTREADWLAIAGDNQKLQGGMERLYRLFKDAPVLGSLINPRAAWPRRRKFSPASSRSSRPTCLT